MFNVFNAVDCTQLCVLFRRIRVEVEFGRGRRREFLSERLFFFLERFSSMSRLSVRPCLERAFHHERELRRDLRGSFLSFGRLLVNTGLSFGRRD